MTDITATLAPGDQSNVQTMTDNLNSGVNDLEAKAALLTAYLPTVGNVMSDQSVLNELTARIGAMAASVTVMHERLNFLAYKAEQYFGLAAGTWHSNAGTYSPTSGGMDKGSP